ncbi:hypothetical protein BG844_01115 [Couchioplanes caeruleus subsp. caeruleus]|uniref:Uncharacterized protein n=2 Tax=Couchioplanes caeruleus TaxID=56438 RepID=A0A1K0FTB3_9ACTN|nr:hypothetical protein BG844_01115 [Couchioplanes caeruleus subsp. caeruleus]
MATWETQRMAPAIRLRRAPRCDTPFDDEREADPWWSPHQLALEWPRLPVATPTPSRQSPPARPTAASGVSADAKLAVRRFVHSCVEVLNGYRPATHLRRLAQPREAAAVVAQGVAAAHKVAQTRRRRLEPHPPGRFRARRPVPVAVVRSSLCEPRPGAVEAAAVLVVDDRTLAMAFRLEQRLPGSAAPLPRPGAPCPADDQAWLATVLRLI